MSRFMPQQLFNMCAVSAVKISAAKGEPVEVVAAQLAESYARSYSDSSLQNDIAAAAQQVKGFLQGVLPPETLIGSLTQMQFCIKHYDTAGRKRSAKLFGGTWFSRERRALPDKVKQCAADIATYHALSISSSVPLAPEGWRL